MIIVLFGPEDINRIIWRGWARLDVTGVLDDRERLARRVDEAVRKILERFPPG